GVRGNVGATDVVLERLPIDPARDQIAVVNVRVDGIVHVASGTAGVAVLTTRERVDRPDACRIEHRNEALRRSGRELKLVAAEGVAGHVDGEARPRRGKRAQIVNRYAGFSEEVLETHLMDHAP